MYIKFDPTKVTFQRVKFRGATTALGGSVRVLDEKEFTKSGKEVFHRIATPMAIVRAFLIKNHQPKFIQPTEGAIIYYGTRVIGLELAPKYLENKRQTEGLFGLKDWTISAEVNFQQLIQPGMREGRWFFDGIYAYTFTNPDMEDAVRAAPNLSTDRKFREMRCRALNLTKLSSSGITMGLARSDATDPLVIEERSCLAYVGGSGVFVVTPPIWKQLGSVGGQAKQKGKDIDETEGGIFDTSAAFDGLNDKVFVNLAFALSAAKELAEVFGYDAIAPLQLPKLMIQMKTVNLPRVVKEIKTTHDIGMQFTHGLAWLLGLLNRASNEEQVNAVRRMLKYLTTKGIYVRARLKASAIHKDEHINNGEVPLLSAAQALKEFNGMSKEQWNIIMKAAALKGKVVDILSLEGEG